MYMRVDSNTRGHHQWFYFKVKNQNFTGPVKFNFVNFTKRQSLYLHGMRVNAKSMLAIADQKAKLPQGKDQTSLKNEGWQKVGDKITYKLSKLSQHHLAPSYASNTSKYNSETTAVAARYASAGHSRKKYY